MATEIVTVESPVIRAAGGIIQRVTPHGDEVLIVFRKRHQDWALPKGEVQDGESFQEAALREMEQETGCTCELGNYLGTVSYADHGTPTVVMFWKMNVVRESSPQEGRQTDQAVWIDLPSAIQKLSQSQEKALLSRIASSTRPAPPVPQAVPGSTSEHQRKKGSIEDE